jgi:DNA-binding SARP family transcriptional activator
LHIRLLGSFDVLDGALRATGIDKPRWQSLFAYLVLHPNTPQVRQHIAFMFWPDSTEVQALTNLRKLLHQLRQTLPHIDRWLRVDRGTVWWAPDADVTLDVADFESALARGAWAAAVELYGGDLLPACYDEWLVPERERLRESYLTGLEQLATAMEQRREYSAAIVYTQQILRHDPLRESGYRRLIRLYALNDDRAAAVHTYHACATIIQRELGVPPAAATRQAYQRLLRSDAMPSPAPMKSLPGVIPLVGRQAEWACLQAAWQAAAHGAPQFVALNGEAGTGKTRLAEELLAWAARQGIATTAAECYAGEGALAYAPVVTWLRAHPLPPLEPVWLTEIARLLPEVLADNPDVVPPGPLTEAWQRQRFFEALARALLGGQSDEMVPRGRGRAAAAERGRASVTLLLIENLQWCDRETLELVHYLLRFDAQAPLLILGTWRTEELAPYHPAAHLLAGLRERNALIEVELQPLDETTTAALAAQVGDHTPAQDEAAHLYQETEGNALFVVEMVRAGLGRGAISGPPGPSDDGLALPPRMRAVLAGRLAQLSPAAHELAGVAAVIGREFTFDLLQAASGTDISAVVQALDELWHRRIARERGARGYDFSHDKIRETAYGELSAARRRLLHGQVAEALVQVHAAALDSVSAQIARHYEQAARPRMAIPFYGRAGKAAARVYAHAEAIRLYQHALALQSGLDAHLVDADCLAQIREDLGDVLELTSQRDVARQTYRAALPAHATAGALPQARLLRKLGDSSLISHEYDEAWASYEAAMALLEAPTVDRYEPWWREWLQVRLGQINWYYWRGDGRAMQVLADPIGPLMAEHGLLAQQLEYYASLGRAALRRLQYRVDAQTLELYKRATQIAHEAGDLTRIVDMQFAYGFTLLWHGSLVEAEAELSAAHELAQRIGYTLLVTQTLSYLGTTARRQCQTGRVRDLATRSLAAATATGRPDYVAISQANLGWAARREGDAPATVTACTAAMAFWSTAGISFPFQWLALWPLIAVALREDDLGRAMAHACEMRAPTQAPLPDEMALALEAAGTSWDNGQATEAREHLDRAAALAVPLGYL